MKREQMIEHLVKEKSPGGFSELVKWTKATHSHTENSVPGQFLSPKSVKSRFREYDTDNMQKCKLIFK